MLYKIFKDQHSGRQLNAGWFTFSTLNRFIKLSKGAKPGTAHSNLVWISHYNAATCGNKQTQIFTLWGLVRGINLRKVACVMPIAHVAMISVVEQTRRNSVTTFIILYSKWGCCWSWRTGSVEGRRASNAWVPRIQCEPATNLCLLFNRLYFSLQRAYGWQYPSALFLHPSQRSNSFPADLPRCYRDDGSGEKF